MSYTNFQTKDFFKKPFIIIAALWLVSCGISVFFRFYPLYFHPSSKAEEKAADLVINALRTKVSQQIQKQGINNPENLTALTNMKLNEIISKNNAEVRNAIRESALKIDRDSLKKGPLIATKLQYLFASDSFYFYGLCKHILKTGRIGGEIKGSKFLHNYMLAPVGHWNPISLHPYLGNLIYLTLKIFLKDIPLMNAIGLTPLLVTCLIILPFLIICRLLGAGYFSSFIGAIYLSLCPMFLRRSTFGWFDNDPYNVLFPLIVICFFFLALEKSQRFKKSAIWAILCSFFIVLYTFFWQGWVYLFSVIVLSCLGILAANLIFERNSPQKGLFSTLGLVVIGAMSIYMALSGIDDFLLLFTEGWDALIKFLTPQISLWPAVYISVGELFATSFLEISKLLGGPLFCGLSILGFVALLIKTLKSKEKIELYKLITIIFFLASSLLMAKKALRFTLLLLVPLSILFPLGLQTIINFLKKLLSQFWPKKLNPQIPQAILLGFIAVGLLFWPLKAAHKLEKNIRPIYNGTWDSVLTKIRNETPPDAIINSWWPPGHFISSVSERRVTFDGATLNMPQAYWIANVFLSQDETKALGLLRMLNNSANQATDFLLNLGFPLSTSTQMIEEICSLPENSARDKLKAAFNPEQINALLELTHSSPAPSYLLLYNDLRKNILALTFAGRWDIKKMEMLNSSQKAVKTITQKKVLDYIRFLWSLQGGQTKFSPPLTILNIEGSNLTFEHGVTINTENKTCTVSSPKYGTGIPQSIFTLEGDEIKEHKIKGSTLSYSVILYQSQNRYYCVLSDRDLANSLFIKLYFFGGKGLKYFKLFDVQSDITKRTKILVYEVDWEKFLQDTSHE